jgi:hypothetical protein
MILQQHVYKLCIGIDLINDNQCWTILINENVPLTQCLGRTSYGQTKIQLQLWNYKTSCRQLRVTIGYLCDGLEHIPPWFKL